MYLNTPWQIVIIQVVCCSGCVCRSKAMQKWQKTLFTKSSFLIHLFLNSQNWWLFLCFSKTGCSSHRSKVQARPGIQNADMWPNRSGQTGYIFAWAWWDKQHERTGTKFEISASGQRPSVELALICLGFSTWWVLSTILSFRTWYTFSIRWFCIWTECECISLGEMIPPTFFSHLFSPCPTPLLILWTVGLDATVPFCIWKASSSCRRTVLRLHARAFYKKNE